MSRFSKTKPEEQKIRWDLIGLLTMTVGLATYYHQFHEGRTYQTELKDEESHPIRDANIQLSGERTSFYPTKIRDDGRIIISDLPQRTTYQIQVYQLSYSRNKIIFTTKSVRINGEDVRDEPWIITEFDYHFWKKISHEIRFQFNSSELSDERRDRWILAQAASHVNRSQECLSILILGHTDENGSSEYNYQLGNRRANAVKKELIRFGAPRERIFHHSLGKKFPKGQGASDEENRRVELLYYNNNNNLNCSTLNLEEMLSEFDKRQADSTALFARPAGGESHQGRKSSPTQPNFTRMPIAILKEESL